MGILLHAPCWTQSLFHPGSASNMLGLEICSTIPGSVQNFEVFVHALKNKNCLGNMKKNW